jgi:hypothetical protein
MPNYNYNPSTYETEAQRTYKEVIKLQSDIDKSSNQGERDRLTADLIQVSQRLVVLAQTARAKVDVGDPRNTIKEAGSEYGGVTVAEAQQISALLNTPGQQAIASARNDLALRIYKASADMNSKYPKCSDQDFYKRISVDRSCFIDMNNNSNNTFYNSILGGANRADADYLRCIKDKTETCIMSARAADDKVNNDNYAAKTKVLDSASRTISNERNNIRANNQIEANKYAHLYGSKGTRSGYDIAFKAKQAAGIDLGQPDIGRVVQIYGLSFWFPPGETKLVGGPETQAVYDRMVALKLEADLSVSRANDFEACRGDFYKQLVPGDPQYTTPKQLCVDTAKDVIGRGLASSITLASGKVVTSGSARSSSEFNSQFLPPVQSEDDIAIAKAIKQVADTTRASEIARGIQPVAAVKPKSTVKKPAPAPAKKPKKVARAAVSKLKKNNRR